MSSCSVEIAGSREVNTVDLRTGVLTNPAYNLVIRQVCYIFALITAVLSWIYACCLLVL